MIPVGLSRRIAAASVLVVLTLTAPAHAQYTLPDLSAWRQVATDLALKGPGELQPLLVAARNPENRGDFAWLWLDATEPRAMGPVFIMLFLAALQRGTVQQVTVEFAVRKARDDYELLEKRELRRIDGPAPAEGFVVFSPSTKAGGPFHAWLRQLGLPERVRVEVRFKWSERNWDAAIWYWR